MLHERPFVVFPGNIQGRSIRETGAKGCTLVEVEDDRIVRLTAHATDVLRWALVTVDAAGAQTRAELAARMRFALAEAEAGAEGRPLIARVVLQGATPLHGALLGDAEALDAECRAAAAAVSGELHIERVPPRDRAARRPGRHRRQRRRACRRLRRGARRSRHGGAAAHRFPQPGCANAAPAQPSPPDLPQTAEALRDLTPEAWQMVAHMLAGGA